MPSAGFEPATQATKWTQTYASDRAAIEVSILFFYTCLSLTSGHFSSGFPVKALYAFLTPPTYSTHPDHLKYLGLVIVVIFEEGDVNVVGVRLRTNVHTARPPSDTGTWTTMVEWWCWQRKSFDSSTRVLWKSYRQSHLVARSRNGRKKSEYCLVKIFRTCKWFFTCRKIFRRVESGVTSSPKEDSLRTFIALKIHCLGRVWTLELWVLWEAH
jgi:hypothetical protein